MNSPTESLDQFAAALRARLEQNDTKVLKWEPTPRGKGERAKVGRGYLELFYLNMPSMYPGVHYCASMGANSDDSYGGFLAGVTWDEAKLLVYGDFKNHTEWKQQSN